MLPFFTFKNNFTTSDALMREDNFETESKASLTYPDFLEIMKIISYSYRDFAWSVTFIRFVVCINT